MYTFPRSNIYENGIPISARGYLNLSGPCTRAITSEYFPEIREIRDTY